MPQRTHARIPARPGSSRRHRRRLGRGRARTCSPHVRPAGADPDVRGVRPRAGRRGLVHGPAHSSIGQEGGAVGSVLGAHQPRTPSTARTAATTSSSPRPCTHVAPKGIDPAEPVCRRRARRSCCAPWPRSAASTAASATAAAARCTCSGRRPARSAPTPSSAAACRWRPAPPGRTGRPAPTRSRSPTSATAPPTSAPRWRRFNLAAAWKLPLCFFIENNQYAVSTTRRRGDRRAAAVRPRPGLRHRQLAGRRDGPAGRPPGHAGGARAHARPATARRSSRPTSTATSTRTGRSPAAPSATAPRRRRRPGGSATRSTSCARPPRPPRPPRRRSGSTQRSPRPRRLMAEIGDVLLEPLPGGKPGQRRITAGRVARPGLRRRRRPRRPERVRRRAATPTATRSPASSPRRKFIDAVAEVMDRRMETDDARSSSWARTCTGSTAAPTAPPAGSRTPFPDRVLGTPISENAFTGLGGGIALDGRFRPVVEFMYADFMWVAADQLFNQIAKARHMFGGDGAVPFVLRSKVAMGTGYGSQHSMDPAGDLRHRAGLADRRAVHAVRLRRADEQRAALRGPGASCSSTSTSTPPPATGPVDDLDYCLPVGKAAVRRTGRGRDGPHLPGDDAVRRWRRSSRSARRRRGDRPALARPGQHRLGHASARASGRPTAC